MAFDLIALGTAPSGEVRPPRATSTTAACVLAVPRFIDLLRHTVGAEPEGAKLRVRRSDPDFNTYVEVVVEFDDANDAARAYANRCDQEAPTRWDRTAQIAFGR